MIHRIVTKYLKILLAYWNYDFKISFMKKHKGQLSDPILNTMKREKKIQVDSKFRKNQSSNKTIHRLQLNVYTTIQDPHKILLEQRLFYKTLYTKTQHLHSSEFIANLQIPKIPENIMENMKSDISWAEFPHLAIVVSPRLEVESRGHAWLDGCNFQQKWLLAPTWYSQRHPADENIDDAGNLHE